MQPPFGFGICGAPGASRAGPLRERCSEPLLAQDGAHPSPAPLADFRRCFLSSARILLLLVASAGIELHAAERPVRIGGVTYLGDAPTVIAQQRDLFRANGVQAEVSYATTGKRNLERLRAGEIDFALMTLTPLVIAHLSDPNPGRDDDPVILASLVHATHLNEVLVPAAGPIDEPADLEGRTVGLSRGTDSEFVWWLFTRYHGLDTNTIDVVHQPASGLADALASGSIDAAVLWSPWRTRLESRTGQELHGFAGVDIYSAKWVLVTRRDVVRDSAALCRAILPAYRDAIAFIQQHPDRAMRLYAEHAGIDPQYLDDPWDPLIYDLNLDWNVVTTLLQQLEWARRRTPLQKPSGGILSLLAPGPLRELTPAAVSIPSSAEAPAE